MPFEILNQNDYILIQMQADCQMDNCQGMRTKFKEMQAATNLKLLVFQCTNCSNIATPVLREMAQIYKEVQTLNGKLRLVAANAQILQIIKNNGLDRILVSKMSLRGALVDFGLVKLKEFDVNFINPFLNATQKVFKIQAQLETKPSKPYLKKPTDPLLLGDISGIISLSSETFTGTLAISISEEIYIRVASNMLGEEIKKIDENNVDLVGELANIILGQAKIELAGLGYSLQMALPSCVWGKDHKIKHFGGGTCVVLPFETASGIFYTEIMASSNVAGLGGQKAKAG